jgi:hypothetical protein
MRGALGQHLVVGERGVAVDVVAFGEGGGGRAGLVTLLALSQPSARRGGIRVLAAIVARYRAAYASLPPSLRDTLTVVVLRSSPTLFT